MLDSITRTLWTVVYIPIDETEPTAKAIDLVSFGLDQPVDFETARALIARRCLCELLDIYPTEDLVEALETYRAGNARETSCL